LQFVFQFAFFLFIAKFFIYFRYKSFIRHMIWKYFLNSVDSFLTSLLVSFGCDSFKFWWTYYFFLLSLVILMYLKSLSRSVWLLMIMCKLFFLKFCFWNHGFVFEECSRSSGVPGVGTQDFILARQVL
jgi:hypothetical protein